MHKPAKKYQVGIMTRLSFAQAIDHLLTSPKDTIVRINAHRGKKYELRAKRKPHGLEITWGLPGTFFCPRGYDNR